MRSLPPAKTCQDRLNTSLVHPRTKPVLWGICVLPLLALNLAFIFNKLGPEPIAAYSAHTGRWALNWLWLSLAITPLRQALGLPALVRLRRSLGLAAFGYALVHLLAFVGLDQGLSPSGIQSALHEHRFIWLGLATFALLLILAATSFNAAVRALGGLLWRRIHQLIYLAAPLALAHFYMHRAEDPEPQMGIVSVYAALLALLLGWRVIKAGGFKALLGLRS